MSNNKPLYPFNSGHLSHPKYRPDIDGLRALAVLSIVGFHVAPFRVAGGFIGVDIFFVISGFLISTIIFENLESNRFSFVEFYSRRIKRIFPALLLVLIASFAIGWVTLLADEYGQLGKHIAGGAGFISNFVFFNESGYFDTAAHTKPLLHLWSLGIEEQFYIVWPLLLWCAWKKNLNLLTITIAVAVISFALNIVKVGEDASAAFYWPQTRFWELLAGSVLAYTHLYTQNWFSGSIYKFIKLQPVTKIFKKNGSALRNAQSFTGAVLIAIGLIIITKESQFPGWWAALPTTGTVLLISAGSQAWLNRTILSNRVLVWFGLISFPLYLWHWPLLSLARIVQSESPSRSIRMAAVVISIVLAWLTYRLVERPIRFGAASRVKSFILLILMAFVGYGGYHCYKQDGLLFRAVVKINPSKHTGWDGGIAKKYLLNECGISDKEGKKLFATCVQDSRQTPKYALLGDSKAAALYPGVFRTSTENGRWLFIGGNGPHSAPVPVLSKNRIYKSYQKLTRIAIDSIAKNKHIETVVLVTATRVLFRLKNDHSIEDLPTSKHYAVALEGLTRATDRLIEAGKKIVIVVDNPTLPDPVDCLNRTTSLTFLNHLLIKGSTEHCRLDLEHHLAVSKKYRDLLLMVATKNPDKIKIFDPTELMCDTDRGVCPPHSNGRLLYRYSDHISDYAAGLIGKNLNTFLLSVNIEKQ